MVFPLENSSYARDTDCGSIKFVFNLIYVSSLFVLYLFFTEIM